jgi:hypothetical protein
MRRGNPLIYSVARRGGVAVRSVGAAGCGGSDHPFRDVAQDEILREKLAMGRSAVLFLCLGLVAASSPTLAQQAAQAPPAPLVKPGELRKVSDHVQIIPDDSVPLVPNG